MSFASLKKNRSAAIEKLSKAAESVNKKSTYGDDREWKPTVDSAGNGYAVIRFLPPAEGQDLPWVQYWDHGFKGSTGRWFFEKSLTTLGKDCPISEMNSRLWNSGIESNKDIARDQKRKLHYVSNILVISDPEHPENDGKVFIYQYGKKIFDKITEAMQPQFADETPMNPFDFWEGADFKIKIQQVAGYRNYDRSEFANPSPLLGGDDAKLEKVYSELHDIGTFTDPSTFKSYSELQSKLVEVCGAEMVHGANAVQAPVESAPVGQTQAAPELKSAEALVEEEDDIPFNTGDSDDLSYFARLASDSV
jgi:hypothetical protein